MKTQTAVGSLSALIVAVVVSAADAQTSSGAEWEVVEGEVPSHWHSIVVPLGGGRALLTGIEWPPSHFGHAYLYDPLTGVRRVAHPPGRLATHFGAPLQDGRALLGGGGTECFIYDPDNDSWSAAASLPTPTNNFYTNYAATLLDGRVLVNGGTIPEPYFMDSDGFTLNFASRRVFIFDPTVQNTSGGKVVTGSWEEVAMMPSTNTFTTYGPPPFWLNLLSVELAPDMQNTQVGRCTHQTLVLRDGRVLLVGGREFEPAPYYGVTPVDVYDPASNQWTRLAELPFAPHDEDQRYGGRGFPGVTLLESGKVLIIGGVATRIVEGIGSDGQVTFVPWWPPSLRRSTLLLDPDTGRWRRVGDLNVGRMGPLAASLPDGGAVAIGGATYGGVPLPAEVFDPSTETWSLLPPEPAPAPDWPLRQGARLTDGTVITWSCVEEGPCTVKRLHPAGSSGARSAKRAD